MTVELDRTPAAYIRSFADAHARGDVPRLSLWLVQAERLADGKDFADFRDFMGLLAKAEDMGALGALLAGPGAKLVVKYEALFCADCRLRKDDFCLLGLDSSTCC